MKTKKLILTLIIALICCSAVTFITVRNQSNKWLGTRNLEALAAVEEPTIPIICEIMSPFIYCEVVCLHCLAVWRLDVGGKFVYALEDCTCGVSLNY